jgi:hypothetical protein
MTAKMVCLLMLTVGGVLPPTTSALADNNWKQSNAIWRQMDKCTRAAQKQYPDHTAEAIAKRDEARRRCFRSSNLPGDDASTQSTAERH